MHQIHSEHKLVLCEITIGLIISNLNEPDHMFITMWALFYNVKAIFLGKNRNSWVGLKETIVIDFNDYLCCFFGPSRKSLGLFGSGQCRGFVVGSIIITKKTTIAPYREELNCTGRCGQPDYDTRVFFRTVSDTFDTLPVFCLVDFNPWGIGIFRSYKCSSYQLTHVSNHLTVGRMQFLGLTYTNITSSGITNDYFTSMSEVDRKCALGIQDEEWISNEKQVAENNGHHLEMGLKVDIEVIPLWIRTYLSNELLPA
ncbi:meiotic recombination protein SPO11-1-like [Chenopodium quinoa]|uniref:meiotic recombination protein SPO11-1-like n=1 Tax=Chenopodium quinoa TaxID=63459 RepID=UPI000B77E8B4|nr:meiotic recombination protein SPO11-1-like [Chenopodium quinoa]